MGHRSTVRAGEPACRPLHRPHASCRRVVSAPSHRGRRRYWPGTSVALGGGSGVRVGAGGGGGWVTTFTGAVGAAPVPGAPLGGRVTGPCTGVSTRTGVAAGTGCPRGGSCDGEDGGGGGGGSTRLNSCRARVSPRS